MHMPDDDGKRYHVGMRPRHPWPHNTSTLAELVGLVFCLGINQAKAVAPPTPVLRTPAARSADQSTDLRTLFMQAQKALQDRDYPAAERGFKEVLKADPQSAAAYINLGVVYMRENRLDPAIAALESGKKLAPNIPGVDLNLGLAHYRKSDYPKAAPYFANVVKAVPATEPTGVQARYLLGMSHFMNDDYLETVQALEPIFKDEQDDIDYLFVLGICYGKLKRTSDSQRTFARLVETGGDTPHLHLLLGKAYLDLYDDHKAQAELEKAVAADPKLPFGHYNLGVDYQRLGILDKAGEQFDQEVAVSPDLPWAYESRGTIYLDQGEIEQAGRMFSKALAINPKLPTSLGGMGKVYMRQGKPQEAALYIQRALALQPDSANLHYQLGQAYLRSGKREDAQKEMAEAGRLQAEERAKQGARMGVKTTMNGMGGPPAGEGRLPAPGGAGSNPQQ